MAKYRTALGKVVDMASLAAKNERTRAVGNMKVNARGDTIDASGKIIKPVTSKVNENYAKTIGNRSAQVQNQAAAHAQHRANPVQNNAHRPAPTGGVNSRIDEAELTAAEKELEAGVEDDMEVEQIKAKETGKK